VLPEPVVVSPSNQGGEMKKPGTLSSNALYAKILGLTAPWEVLDVEIRTAANEIHITVGVPEGFQWFCPDCQDPLPIHDHRERTWRHLDTCQLQTFIHARVPRLSCKVHGVRQIQVPWAEDGSKFTVLFEALVIDWLQEASVSAVAFRLGISWEQAMGIMKRAVKRGQAREKSTVSRYLGIDETSERKGHEYLTIVSNLEESKVLFVGFERKTETLDQFWETRTPEQLEGVVAVAMDMWPAYINSTMAHLPEAETKIVFDKFHIAQHLSKAVDSVRKKENRALLAEGLDWLQGTKYWWLRNLGNMTFSQKRSFLTLVRSHAFKTGRAWAIAQTFMVLYDYVYAGVVEKRFAEWFGWARRSKLEPIKKVALMIKDHWANIVTYFSHRITNAGSEGINALIQKVKRKAHGYRNSENFRIAILFHLGGLDLYSERLRISA